MIFDRNEKNKKPVVGLILTLVLIIGLSIFVSRVLNVSALSANYSKAPSSTLSTAEWNNLPNDFLAKSGDADGIMSGPLSMDVHRITNVAGPSATGDLATKSYVDGLLSTVAGGAVFTNWGRNDCPTGTDKLYDGFGFGSEYDDLGGGNELICLQAGGTWPAFPSIITQRSLLQPMITIDYAPAFPSGFPLGKFIRCAVCYNGSSSCYEKTNSWTCDGGYTAAYTGYLAGAIRGVSSNVSTRDRSCLNSNMDGSDVLLTSPTNSKVIVQGTKIDSNLGISGNYTTGNFTRCAVCCN